MTNPDRSPILDKSPFHTGTVEVGGIDISYMGVGKGTPLVFIHGWSLQYRSWELQIEAFRDQYRVIAYDFRGTGTSGGGDSKYSFDDLVAELDGFLNEVVGDERPILVGHSLGASLVLQYMAEHPGRCLGVVAADVGMPTGVLRVEGVLQAALNRMAVRLFGLDATTDIVTSILWSQSYRENNPAVLAMAKSLYQSNSPASLVHSEWAWAMRRNVDDELSNATTPTLLIIGSEDGGVSLSSMQDIQQLIPGSKLEVIEGAGHMVYVEKPDEFNRILTSFFRSLPTP
jgi:3-oxoadipate enol-lactonase